jgi:elongator complex protein 6
MASRSPPLLEPYLRLPHETSLILLSGVLGSSTNWLVHRYLYSLLSSSSYHPHPYPRDDESTNTEPLRYTTTSVVLVSFLRDYPFWKDGSKRLGLDLDVVTRKGSFIFVDGLTSLFMPCSSEQGRSRPPSASIDSSGKRVLLAATTDHLRRALEDAVAHVQGVSPGTQVVLVIDQPDLLLAASGDTMSGQDLRDTILSLREVSDSSPASISFYR